jgi:hypothetical protein
LSPLALRVNSLNAFILNFIFPILNNLKVEHECEREEERGESETERAGESAHAAGRDERAES